MNANLRIRKYWTCAAMLAALVFTLLAPLPAVAADPFLNPSCWPSAQCQTAGGQFEADPNCTVEGWGYCYVQKSIPIQIKLPGLEQREVRDLAQYIQVIYVWAVRVAAILAVVVIMVGGLIWLTSEGAERLGKAKELIGNAVIGLLIAVFSYIILNTINPDLVRLSLPRTKMIRAIFSGAQFCSGVPADVPIHEGSAEGSIIGEGSRNQLLCGRTFYTPTAAGKTCIGDFCDPDKVCVPNEAGERVCQDGMIGGEVNGDGQAFLDNDVELHVVCADGSDHEILSTDGKEVTPRQRDTFLFPMQSGAIEDIEGACGANGFTRSGTAPTDRVRGFTIWIEVNDDDSIIGTGNDDWYAVGAESCNQSTAKPITATPSDEGDPSDIAWRSVADNKFINQMTIYAAVREQNPARFQCNLVLNRSDDMASGFPDR